MSGGVTDTRGVTDALGKKNSIERRVDDSSSLRTAAQNASKYL